MESGQRVSRKGRKLGSSRRRQTREPADGEDAPVVPEPDSWSSQTAAELQGFFQDCGAMERGFITRNDLAMAKFSFLSSEEEPEMIFDWVDTERKGHLSLEEFSTGLRNIFGSNPSTHRLRRRKPTSSKRGSMTTSLPVLEEANLQEKEQFFAFMEQLGPSHLLPEQAEIWQLWGKLRQEEPQQAGNLEGFLAKMNSRLQEVRADKEVLELTLRKRDADHQREVQQLYEEMEQQISQEKQQLQAESHSRSLALDSQMQEALEAKEREVQQLAEGQRELEAQLHSLSSTNLEANSENQQLREAERDLVGQLEEVQGQLRETRGHLRAARGLVSWDTEEEPSIPRAGEKALDPQTVSPEEAPLPGLFGDNDDWDHLLSRFSSPPHRGLQISWSPPPTPSSYSGPQTPRVVRQISISEPQFLFSQEPSSDPDGAPGSLPRVPSRANRGKGVDPDGQDTRLEQPVEPHSLEPKEESGFGTETHFRWGLPGAPNEESGGLVAAALKVLVPLEEGHPPHVNPTGPREHLQASNPDDKGLSPGPIPAKPPRQREALYQDPHTAGSEPGLGSPGARALTPGLAEPSQGPTERSKQHKPGPDVLAAHPEGIREAHGQILRPDGLAALPSQGLEKKPRAERKGVDGGGPGLSLEQAGETSGLRTGHLERPQQDAMAAPPPSDAPQTQAEAESPAPGKSSPLRSPPPKRAQPEDGAGPLASTDNLPTVAKLKAQPRSPPTTSHREGEQGSPQSREQGAENRPEDPGTDSGKTEPTPSPETLTASKPPADPDYVFHVIFLGDSNVGKTSFLHLLHQNSFATGLTATVGVDFRVKTLLVDNKCFALQLWDTAGQERYHSVTRQLFHKADGVVLMYDVTSQESFAHVRYWLDCLQDAGSEGVVILLLGNKTDCEEARQVPTKAGQQLAQELGVSFAECSAALGHNILEPMMNLARGLAGTNTSALWASELMRQSRERD
ncbi:ras-related protein Rab-44 [Talpa occidentalis]|uniref:ras-related protein Rab-44 n=1 Tax=Talpa occidentalis TaxID=50954 RepID=UPI0023F74CAF|nr:ras-related protein Rab-44 [Talpa occidentalis]